MSVGLKNDRAVTGRYRAGEEDRNLPAYDDVYRNSCFRVVTIGE